MEVLRGPQGTLFGRNTPAGLVKFTSNRPTQDLEGYFSASYASLNTLSMQGAISGGLTDSISARVSLLKQTRDDYIDTKAPGFEQNDVFCLFVRFVFANSLLNKLLTFRSAAFRSQLRQV